jgi:hypothetical protein
MAFKLYGGSPFNSNEFKEHLTKHGIKHQTSTPD